ncbi:hypothetical protein [uncultured Clostridium sp.]|nr:hypothetical protein [uncultured Clostridium sp.]
MKEIKYNEIAADQYTGDERRRPERPERSERCGEIRIECDTVNININCRS